MPHPPKQKPGRSEQNVQTPPEFVKAVLERLKIEDFQIDLAASIENTVTDDFYTEDDDSLIQPWNLGGWNWCNPPYGDIEPWVAKAANEAQKGAQIAMLVPASVGSNWWRDYVEPYAYQSFLNGRLTFIGHKTPYPKDLALLLYTPWGFTGHEIWNWRVN